MQEGREGFKNRVRRAGSLMSCSVNDHVFFSVFIFKDRKEDIRVSEGEGGEERKEGKRLRKERIGSWKEN